MKNLLNIFGRNEVTNTSGILNNPGDKLEARITDTNRKVLKVSTDNGSSKYSATQYPKSSLRLPVALLCLMPEWHRKKVQ
jgi:hypothetical protein